MSTTPTKTKNIEDIDSINAMIAAAEKQTVIDRETIATRHALHLDRITKPILPDLGGYILAHTELPVLQNILDDIDYQSPETRKRQAGDKLVISINPKLITVLNTELARRVENKRSALDRIAEKVGSYAKETISALTRASAADAEERLEKAREEAAAIEYAIRDATHSIRMLEIAPSVEAWGMAAAAVRRVIIS